MFSVSGCGWRLRFWLRLRSKSTLRLEAGAGAGAGMGAGAGLGAGMGTGMGAEAEAMEYSGIPPGDPNIRIVDDFWSHFQNPKMLHSLPVARYTIPIITLGFTLNFAFQGTLGSESAWGPPHFHRFPSY